MKSVIGHLSLVLCWLAPAVSWAGVSVSMPLGGYYREGKYMPVGVHVDEPGEVEIRGLGGVNTRVAMTGKDVVAPVLVMRGPLSEMVVRAGGAEAKYAGPTRMLGNSERLVGVVGGDYELAKTLFAPAVVVAVQLNADDPLPGAGVASGMLDGVVMDQPVLERAGAAAIDELLTCGTVVAVKSENPPRLLAVWERQGAYWVGRRNIAGPSGAIVNESAYAPTYGWEPGWPASVRFQVMIMGAVFAAAMILMALVRGRWMVLGQMVIALGALGAEFTFARAHPALFTAAGSVVVRDGGVTQVDSWNYQACVKGTEAALRWNEVTWPMWESTSQLDAMKMELRCDGTGKPIGFVYRLPDRGRAAFMSRAFETTPAMTGNAGQSPMQGVARALYFGDGITPTGQQTDESYGQVLLERRGAK